MQEFVKNMGVLSFGNVLAQIITIAVLPIITRMIGPEEYAIFAVFLSLTMVIGRISTLQYHSAIMLPKEESLADTLFVLSVAIAILVSIVTLVVIVILYFMNSEGLFQGGLNSVFFLLPFAVAAHGNSISTNTIALRKNEFRRIAVSRVFIAVVDRGLSLALIAGGGLGITGLAFGRIFGPLIGNFWLQYNLLKSGKLAYFRIKRNIWSNVKQVARRYQEFPLYSIWATLLNGFSNQLPTFLLILYFDPVATGLFAIAMRVVNMPMIFVGDAIAKVFFQKACESRRNGRALTMHTQKMFSALFYISCPPIILLGCYGETLFSFVFGPEWDGAGPFIQVLGLAFVFTFVHRPISSLYDVFEKQKPKLIFNIILITGKFCSITIAAWATKSVIITLATFSVMTILIYIGSFFYIFKLIGVNGFQFTKFLVRSQVVLSVVLLGIPTIHIMFDWTMFQSMIATTALLFIQIMVIILMETWVRELILAKRK